MSFLKDNLKPQQTITNLTGASYNFEPTDEDNTLHQLKRNWLNDFLTPKSLSQMWKVEGNNFRNSLLRVLIRQLPHPLKLKIIIFVICWQLSSEKFGVLQRRNTWRNTTDASACLTWGDVWFGFTSKQSQYKC